MFLPEWGSRTGDSDYSRTGRQTYYGVGAAIALRFRTGRHLTGVEGGYCYAYDEGWLSGGFVSYHYEFARAARLLSLSVGIKAGYWEYPFGCYWDDSSEETFTEPSRSDGEIYGAALSALISGGLGPLRLELDISLLIGTEATGMFLFGLAIDIPAGRMSTLER